MGERAVISPPHRGRARQAAVLVALVVAIPTMVQASPSEDARTAAPARIVVVAGGCESESVDATALAAALRVEMIQEGVFAVDVAAPGSSPLEDPSVATVRLLPASCQAGAGAPGFEITDGATGRSVRSTLAIADIDRGIRARVAALVIAERLRASWTDLASVPTAQPPAEVGGNAPDGGTAPTPGGHPLPDRAGPSVTPPPPASSAPEEIETPSELDRERTQPPRGAAVRPSRESLADRRTHTVATQRFVLGAALEGRSFFGPATGLVGPRALAVLPGSYSALRIHVDAGLSWGTAHDTLGDVSVMLASGALGLVVAAGLGALRFELGPKAEIGWAWVRGLPRSSGARGSTAGAALSAASVLASLYAELARHWVGLAAIDVGFAFSGVDARADTRPVADTTGLMLGVRAGFAYAF